MVRSKPRPQPHEGQAFDYAEAVNSASSVSTTPNNTDPFASDDLGETVIRVDKAVTHMLHSANEGEDSHFSVPVLGPIKTDSAMPIAPGLVSLTYVQLSHSHQGKEPNCAYVILSPCSVCQQ